MLDDGKPNFGVGSNAGSVDPTQPLVFLVQQLEGLTSATFDEPEEFIDEIVQELLEMPPEKRFEEGMDVVEEHAVDEFGSIDAAEAQFPIAEAILFTLLEQLLTEWAGDLAEKSLRDNRKEKNALLVILAAVDVIQNSFNAIQMIRQSEDGDESSEFKHLEFDKQDKRLLGSILIAMYARLYREIKRDREGKRPDFAAIAEDVLYGERAQMKFADPNFDFPEIQSMSAEEIASGAICRGAMRAYTELDISIGRGAELAEMRQQEFKELLEINDIQPDFGPESVEDLYSGADLMDE